MKRLFAFALACLCALPALATTAVTGNIKNLNTSVQSSRTFVRFILAGCSSGQPRVIGTAVIANFGTGIWQQDFTPDGTGAISGTLYSTRDSTGLLGGEIDCNGSTTAVYYNMYVCSNGVCGHAVPVHAKNGVTLDITQVTPISTTPVVTAPSGDSTYCRLDGGNCGFTGTVTHGGHDDTGIGTLGAVTATISGNETVGGTLGVTGTSTLAAVSATQVTNTGDTLLSSGKVVKWNADAGISRTAAATFAIGNGTQADTSGTILAAKAQFNPATTTGFDLDVTGNGRLSGGNQSQYCWTSGNANGTTDTGLSRDAADVIDVGNCTLSDRSGTLGVTNIIAPAGSSLQVPTVGTKLISDTATQTLTGKTYDTAGAGNIFSINSVQITNPPGILFVGCTGTVASATTSVLNNGACTNGTGYQLPLSARILANLRCHAVTGGTNASSGVVSVRKNGVASALTCTFGTGTSCNDTTHTVSFAAGDLFDINFTTQTSDTLAGINCGVDTR